MLTLEITGRNRRLPYFLHATLIVFNVITSHELVAPAVIGSPAVEPPNRILHDDVTSVGSPRSNKGSPFAANIDLEPSNAAVRTNTEQAATGLNLRGGNIGILSLNSAERNVGRKSSSPSIRSPFSGSKWRSPAKSIPDEDQPTGGRYRRSRWSRNEVQQRGKRFNGGQMMAGNLPNQETSFPIQNEPGHDWMTLLANNKRLANDLRNVDYDETEEGGKLVGYENLEWPQWLSEEPEQELSDSNYGTVPEPGPIAYKRAYPPHVGDALLKRLAAAGKPELGSWNGNQRGWVSNNVRIWG